MTLSLNTLMDFMGQFGGAYSKVHMKTTVLSLSLYSIRLSVQNTDILDSQVMKII